MSWRVWDSNVCFSINEYLPALKIQTYAKSAKYIGLNPGQYYLVRQAYQEHLWMLDIGSCSE
jgi:hypothetical protein